MENKAEDEEEDKYRWRSRMHLTVPITIGHDVQHAFLLSFDLFSRAQDLSSTRSTFAYANWPLANERKHSLNI